MTKAEKRGRGRPPKPDGETLSRKFKCSVTEGEYAALLQERRGKEGPGAVMRRIVFGEDGEATV